MSERFTRMTERGLSGLVAAGLAAAMFVVVSQAAAQPRPQSLVQAETADESLAPSQRDQLFPAQRAGGVSLEQATAMALRRYPGTVAGAQTVQMGDRVVYQIRIVDAEGGVRTVRIDAQTGSFL